ncbi:MAG TPA: polyribonucleotide nucleotidyltransferase [Longimicrobiales bacterium]|nr:polyribonucleotide nucleotidyltransferase [Longimicrobiales bacterium]
MHRKEWMFAGRRLVLETGRMAKQAHGACLVQYGETVALCTVTAQDRPTHLPFFPLTVEYRTRSYAAGKIPGGFFKREGRPAEQEILAARLIDRPIRPLFPDGFQNETQVMVHVLSADQENDADVLGMIGTSVALNLSKIPFEEPIAGVRIGRIQGQWVLNPTFQQLEYSDVEIVVAGTEEAIMMVEGGAIEVPEEEIAEGLIAAHEGIKELCRIQREFMDGLQQPKMAWEKAEIDESLRARVAELSDKLIGKAMGIADKASRNEQLAALREEVQQKLAEDFPESESQIAQLLGKSEKAAMRRQILEKGVRSDGRKPDEIRPITSEIGVLPRTHGSALFTRGQTQALAVATLGTQQDEQRIESVNSATETTKSFMLHYNFPPFSTGEAKPLRGTSRREQGHGALAERAIQPLLPAYDEFPYTIRVVSEVLESNGSSSMASVCGASLALMDAGVPLRAPCAGVAMGLIKEGDKVEILTDILGVEDALGDMDFKVAGSEKGVTSIQMDIKISGLTLDVMRTALERARKGRLHILGEMSKVITTARGELSQWAPRIITIQVNPEKIGEIIGPKGKTIRAIQEETGAQISIDDSGLVTIASVSGEGGERAKARIKGMTQDPEVGLVYEGVVKSTTAFGAFVEILPGTEGLLHISEMQEGRTERTEDVVKKGDVVRVKLLSIDEKGKMRLSRKAAMAEEAAGAGAGAE